MFSFEHKKKPLLPLRLFYKRLIINATLAFIIVVVSLMIGTVGYICFAHLAFADAFLNASMILAGMGPVDPMPNLASKYFASFYAIFSGVTFLTTIAVLLAPVLHRALHKFHLATEEEEEKQDKHPRTRAK